MHTIGIQHKRGIWDVILPSCLGQRQSFFQHREDCFSHRLRSPRLKWSTFTEPQIMHQALVCVPTLLPHWLKLVLVAVCWKMAIRTTENNSQWPEINCYIQKQWTRLWNLKFHHSLNKSSITGNKKIYKQ